MAEPGAPLRVLQLVQAPQRRGAEVFANDLSGALRRDGHHVRVLYLYGTADECPFPLQEGDAVLGGDVNHPFERTLGFHPGLLRRLRRRVAAFAPDIVQANGARTLKYAALAASASGRQWRLVYRNIGEPSQWMTNRRARFFYRAAVMRRVDGVVGVSNATLDDVRRVHGLAVPMRRLPRAVDLEAVVSHRSRASVRAELGTEPGSVVLALVGRLAPEKRPDRFVATVATVRRTRPDVVGWIVGAGPSEQAVGAAVEHAGAEGFRVVGERSDVADVLAAADAVVITSDSEGIPGVVLEAAALGVPAVATDVGGVHECIRHGETGLLVPAGDDGALADAVLQMVDDPPQRASMGEKSRQLVEREFDIGSVSRHFVDFYRDLLANRAS